MPLSPRRLRRPSRRVAPGSAKTTPDEPLRVIHRCVLAPLAPRAGLLPGACAALGVNHRGVFDFGESAVAGSTADPYEERAGPVDEPCRHRGDWPILEASAAVQQFVLMFLHRPEPRIRHMASMSSPSPQRRASGASGGRAARPSLVAWTFFFGSLCRLPRFWPSRTQIQDCGLHPLDECVNGSGH